MKVLQWTGVMALLLFVALPLASAVDLNTTISPTDQASFDQMLTPVMKIYNFVKYGATAIAAIMLLFAGINFMMNGNDPKKREDAKHMASYTIIGLVLIWVTPIIVQYLVA